MWYTIDAPGSQGLFSYILLSFNIYLMIKGDGAIFDGASKFIEDLPHGCWILGDSAFAIRPGRVERRRKKNENLPSDPDRARFQLQLDRFCSKVLCTIIVFSQMANYYFGRFAFPLSGE